MAGVWVETKTTTSMALILAGMLSLGLVACGDDGGNGDADGGSRGDASGSNDAGGAGDTGAGGGDLVQYTPDEARWGV